MYETDVESQLKLQQFSPLVTAMVIDSQTGGSGFFRADSKTKEAVPVISQNVGTEVATPVSAPYALERAMYPQAPPPAAPAPLSIRTILLVVILITLAVTGGIVALAYYRGPARYGGNLAIAHTPPTQSLIVGMGTLTLDANVTGSNLQNVTLAYWIIERAGTAGGVIVGDLVRVPMLLKAAGCSGTCQYSYTLPPSEVSGLYVQYYISAFDSSSPPNVVRTDVYTLNVGDFDWHDDKTVFTIVRNIPGSVSLALDSINGFNDVVTIKIATEPPLGVRITPANAQVRPPSPAVLTITSADNAQTASKYDIEIDAVYAVRGVQITRSTTLELTVTDFDIGVSPSYQKAELCSSSALCTTKDALYTVTLVVYDGFTAPNGFTLSVNGLPDYTSYEVLLASHKIAMDGTQTLVYNIRINANTSAKVDKYLFEVRITAGPRFHAVGNIQLEIAS